MYCGSSPLSIVLVWVLAAGTSEIRLPAASNVARVVKMRVGEPARPSDLFSVL